MDATSLPAILLPPLPMHAFSGRCLSLLVRCILPTSSCLSAAYLRELDLSFGCVLWRHAKRSLAGARCLGMHYARCRSSGKAARAYAAGCWRRR